MFAVVIALNYSRTTVTSCMYVVYYIYILHVGTVYFLIFLGLKNVLGTNCSTRHTFLKSYGRCSLAHARFYFTMQHKTNNLAQLVSHGSTTTTKYIYFFSSRSTSSSVSSISSGSGSNSNISIGSRSCPLLEIENWEEYRAVSGTMRASGLITKAILAASSTTAARHYYYIIIFIMFFFFVIIIYINQRTYCYRRRLSVRARARVTGYEASRDTLPRQLCNYCSM